jgi:hypothetical protein
MESDANKIERFQVVVENDKGKTRAGRLIDAALNAEADESPDAFDRIMGKLDLTKKPEPEPKPVKN